MVICIVSDNSLKKLPASPLIRRKGKWMTMVLSEEATMAGNRSRMASRTTRNLLSSGFSSCTRYICSMMTMASSIIRPTEAAMAPSDMMLMVMPTR